MWYYYYHYHHYYVEFECLYIHLNHSYIIYTYMYASSRSFEGLDLAFGKYSSKFLKLSPSHRNRYKYKYMYRHRQKKKYIYLYICIKWIKLRIHVYWWRFLCAHWWPFNSFYYHLYGGVADYFAEIAKTYKFVQIFIKKNCVYSLYCNMGSVMNREYSYIIKWTIVVLADILFWESARSPYRHAKRIEKMWRLFLS